MEYLGDFLIENFIQLYYGEIYTNLNLQNYKYFAENIFYWSALSEWNCFLQSS